mmetsp:Transcript_17847/g.39123  ORF Transcript_17847/g.39123 Transcript_17847/m.39123 type:complete len:621 (+) Transcript_17847:40-1902(+)
MAPGRFDRWSPCVFALVLLLQAGADSHECHDEESCQAHVKVLLERLQQGRQSIKGSATRLKALSEVRSAIVSGNREEMPSVWRHHLAKGSPLITDVTWDAKHPPVSTDAWLHLIPAGSVEVDFPVQQYSLVSLKGQGKQAVLLVDEGCKLWAFTSKGDNLLAEFDLGHEPGSRVTHMVHVRGQDGTPAQGSHILVTADGSREARVHFLRVVMKREPIVANSSATNGTNSTESSSGTKSADSAAERKVEEADDGVNVSNEESSGSGNVSTESEASDDSPVKVKTRTVTRATSTFKCVIKLPVKKSGEVRNVSSVMIVDRGSQNYFIVGDTQGSISMYHLNCTKKGRVRVTEDHGGVKGLMKSTGLAVLFYTSHSFGTFSTFTVDVQENPCSGWNSPLFDIAVDTVNSRAALALENGDIAVYATKQTGKQGQQTMTCDLLYKLPKTSVQPHRVNYFRGHVIALPVALDEGSRGLSLTTPELLFFNLGAVHSSNYGTAPSRALALQISFAPHRLESFMLTSTQVAGKSTAPTLALSFAGETGVQLYTLSLKQPPPPPSEGDDWLEWFPKQTIFGVAMVGVVVWNARKAELGGGGGLGGLGEGGELDEETIAKIKAMAPDELGD